MIIHREEPWGVLRYESRTDEISADVKEPLKAQRLDHAISVTCLLDGVPGAFAAAGTSDASHTFSAAEAKPWSRHLALLHASGVLRVNLAGAEAIPGGDLLEILEAAKSLGLAVVVSARSCSRDLERLAGLPGKIPVQVPLYLEASDRDGQALEDRLEVLRRCREQGMRVRVLTDWDVCPVSLTELGAGLVRAGVQDWRISLSPHGQRLHSTEEDLSDAFPWFDARWGEWARRESHLMIRPDGGLLTQNEDGTVIFLGGVETFAPRAAWPASFLNEHADLWVSRTEVEEIRREPELPILLPAAAGYDAFLSYNHQDRGYARDLAMTLRDRGLRVWFDERALAPGAEWQKEIEEALQESPAIMVLFGKDGAGPFQSLEARAGASLFAWKDRLVIPVILPDVQGEPRIPLFLQHFQAVDLRRPELDPVGRLVDAILRQRAAALETIPR